MDVSDEILIFLRRKGSLCSMHILLLLLLYVLMHCIQEGQEDLSQDFQCSTVEKNGQREVITFGELAWYLASG